jgi:hypothetical protein
MGLHVEELDHLREAEGGDAGVAGRETDPACKRGDHHRRARRQGLEADGGCQGVVCLG